MLIINEHSKEIFNFSNICKICLSERKYRYGSSDVVIDVVAYTKSDKFTIATYSTRIEAEDVFKKIINSIIVGDECFYMPKGTNL